MPTAAQRKVRAKFAAKVKQAKAIKAKHPKMKFSTAVKKAWNKK